jgi:hypothetical protein
LKKTDWGDEDDGSVALPGLFANLKILFNGWRFSGEAWEMGPDKVKEHFQTLSSIQKVSMPEKNLIN